MKTGKLFHTANHNPSHTVLSEEEKQAIRVAIERYKQTGKMVSLKEIELAKNRKKY